MTEDSILDVMQKWVKKVLPWHSKSDTDVILKYPIGKRYYSDFHNIRKIHIDEDAQKVIGRLSQFGYKAYIVGGCVRDLLLNRQPKDYDIVTNATPAEVKKLFVNSRVIGKRFRIVHVVFKGNKIIEVSTARSLPSSRDKAKNKSDLLLTRDNEYGSFKEDAARRDFTINSLFFDIRNESIIDYTGGYDDIKNKIVRTIGDENVSLPEDPVRMLRAIKFAALLEFSMHSKLVKGIQRNRKLIRKAAIARMHEEYNKIFRTGFTFNIFKNLVDLSLFDSMFPTITRYNSEKSNKWPKKFDETKLGKKLYIADRMIAEHEDINTTIYYALLCDVAVEEYFQLDPHDKSVEKNINDKLSMVSEELGLSKREYDRISLIFSAQRNFYTQAEEDEAWIEIFKGKPHFIESFVYYKIRVRAEEDQAGIQRAFSWDIGLRKKIPSSIRKITPRSLSDKPKYQAGRSGGKKPNFFTNKAKKLIGREKKSPSK